MVARKKAKKSDLKKDAAGVKATGSAPARKAAPKTAAGAPREAAPSRLAPASRPAGPTARTCPLVLDGEVDAADFSSSDCMTCNEFDCPFCEAVEGSGALRGRLFAPEGDGEEGDDGFGGDFDFEGGEGGGEEGGEEDGEEDDLL